MTQQRTLPIRPRPAERTGHLVGAVVNGLLLLAVHVWPGWQVVPFLSAETPAVLGAVDAVLVTGLVVHLVLVLPGPAWRTPAGNLVTSLIGAAATLRIIDVFPFTFEPGSGWGTVVRVLLVLGVIGAAIGAVVAVVQLLRVWLVTGR